MGLLAPAMSAVLLASPVHLVVLLGGCRGADAEGRAASNSDSRIATLSNNMQGFMQRFEAYSLDANRTESTWNHSYVKIVDGFHVLGPFQISGTGYTGATEAACQKFDGQAVGVWCLTKQTVNVLGPFKTESTGYTGATEAACQKFDGQAVGVWCLVLRPEAEHAESAACKVAYTPLHMASLVCLLASTAFP
uniref:Uncharacterized protein n=1 Tax=Zooxanthella nutricula TaxID=1333877 RepID=A0A7S2PC95_9DINO|mmetsp:Transcript_5311/g.15832  ORF Transcript_5311/g.15832 Transcript_5311/m.15832 type:complete len:192 (+) Transcript_5311:106-681(+)